MRRKKKRGKKRPLRYAIIQGELNRINKNNDPTRLNLYLALCFCVACQEKEMEKQKILYQQARLHARGAAEMVLQMISASKGNRENLRLAISRKLTWNIFSSNCICYN